MSQASKDITYTSAVEHHVMDILNPTLQHHDFLQSYVRTRVEVGSDSKQDPVEPEGLAHPSNDDRNDNDSRDVHNKREKKEKLDPTTIESEMRIQKSKRK
ncbi:uncharacterized protein LOC113563305 [Ooceraea biroi]|uniref:uncharacterized protein LOC113563305 n=1 Tax=Ooceraea biroi TaxID=2015173 RepID=UPI000F07C12A|nr:uncharacterized protein LOC113563305 [Ooceraea biroi]